MRVITGSARGKRLIVVDGLDVRPTTEKVKEAVFSSIQFEIEGAMVLDLFCGSGQMGIEALSRGANFAVFVDSGRKSQDVTKQNLVNTNLFKSARVVAMEAKSFLATTKDKFDIVFMDPPYSKGIIQEILPILVPKMNESGVIICEHEKIDVLPDEVDEFVLTKNYNYGRISVSAFRHK